VQQNYNKRNGNTDKELRLRQKRKSKLRQRKPIQTRPKQTVTLATENNGVKILN